MAAKLRSAGFLTLQQRSEELLLWKRDSGDTSGRSQKNEVGGNHCEYSSEVETSVEARGYLLKELDFASLLESS